MDTISIMGGVIIALIINGVRLDFALYDLQKRQTFMSRDLEVRFRLLQSKLEYLQSHGRQGQSQDPKEESIRPCQSYTS